MKKILVASAVFTFSILFSGCDFLLDALESGGSGSYNTTTAYETVTWNYSSGDDSFKVNSRVKNVIINNVPTGKILYLAKTNPMDKTISSKHVRYIQRAGYRSAMENDFSRESSVAENLNFASNHFIPQDFSKFPITPSSERSATLPQNGRPVEQLLLVEGSTKKAIYVDDSYEMNSFSQKTATLRAVGTYCNVWIIDDYYTNYNSNQTGKKVNSAKAKIFAEKFDGIYNHIHRIFGTESDKIFYDFDNLTGFSTKSMNYLSDTGSKINIVIYDIAADGDLPLSGGYKNQKGVLGYFYSKDYYPNAEHMKQINNRTYTQGYQSLFGTVAGDPRNYSNEGKYFYIDSYFVNNNFEGTVSTLAHEFQHMVNFGMKDMKGYGTPDTAYNEMLSMLCEDVMFNNLNIDEKNGIQMKRLPGFNALYFSSGIMEYRNDEKSAQSYYILYGFGSWLCRKYGGAQLIHSMMTNPYINEESILDAVYQNCEKRKTMDELAEEFFCYLVSQKPLESVPVVLENQTYTMNSLNLWDSAFNVSEILNKEVPNGPLMFNVDSEINIDLRPKYGFTLHSIGKVTTSKSILIEFSDYGAEDLEMYLIIQ